MRRPDEETLVGSASSATSFLEPDGCAVQKFQCDPKSAAASPRKERSISLEQKQTGMLFKSKARTSLSMSSTHHQIKTGEFKTFLLSPENENIPKTGYNYTPKVESPWLGFDLKFRKAKEPKVYIPSPKAFLHHLG